MIAKKDHGMKMRYPSETGRNMEMTKTAAKDPEVRSSHTDRSFKEDSVVMLQRWEYDTHRKIGKKQDDGRTRSGAHRVRRIITVPRRLQNHKKTIKLISDVNTLAHKTVTQHSSNTGEEKSQSNRDHHHNDRSAGADIKYKFYNPRLRYAQLSRLVAVISGSLSSVSLISIFLPYLPGRLIFIVGASFSIFVSRSLIISICRLLYQMIMKTFFQVVGIWNRLKGSDLMEQPRLPV
ncbi:hypothetical protein JRO89_XS01G0027500 [Xanthoceras sorbifolium]|uniref:Uncharacterized protein n=1 Tax=Xanthoceras sorbifolium TaxID=99658 RepID=A0ABQ8IHY8_9ROSI|nr:hypothetical protein JRO89_XS01G0027500 [Xanthoceras sorbifolium]